MITFLARLEVASEDAPALEAVLGYVREMTLRHEPGVAWYEFARSADTPGTYVVIEVYRDAQAHEAHMDTAWVKASIPQTQALVRGRIAVEQYVGPGSQPAVRRFKEG